GQDTLRLSLVDTKALMLKQNLQLVASHFDLEASEANLLQARAWNNPYFNWNQDLYSIEKNKYLNYRNQFLVQIDQVFSIAGKYTKTVKLAKLENMGNRLQVQDIMRALLYECSLLYKEALLLQAKQALYRESEESYRLVIESAQKQSELGFLSTKELIRLQSELLALRTESSQNTSAMHHAIGQIKMLLNLRPDVELVLEEPLSWPQEAPPLPTLFTQGENNRADYLWSRNQVQVGEAQVQLQKSKAIPDITFGYQPKDRGSNYVRPYSGIEVGFELPLFHRNAGNIKAAQAQFKKTEIEVQRKENQLYNEIASSVKSFVETRQSFERFSLAFMDEVENLQESAEQNYLKKNINILEYIDLKRIYIQNRMQYLEVRSKLLESAGHLNFVVGTEIMP
ncbi:MAG: TolC family protein, partial [Bacteroidetes bacterium]|nr:TolC family protein [Bacteroidota bacterium]